MKGHILSYLENHDFVKRRDLLTYLHSLGIIVSDRRMRKEIEDMVKVDRVLIESSEKGYHLADGEENWIRAVQYLRKKAFPILERAAILERGLKEKFDSRHIQEIEEMKKQLQLFL